MQEGHSASDAGAALRAFLRRFSGFDPLLQVVAPAQRIVAQSVGGSAPAASSGSGAAVTLWTLLDPATGR